jgi:hypothetical protein
MNFHGAGNNFPINSGYSGFELQFFQSWHGPVSIGTSSKFFLIISLKNHGLQTSFFHGFNIPHFFMVLQPHFIMVWGQPFFCVVYKPWKIMV